MTDELPPSKQLHREQISIRQEEQVAKTTFWLALADLVVAITVKVKEYKNR